MTINGFEKVKRELGEILGKENVKNDNESLNFFTKDGSIESGTLRDLIITPTTIEQIQKRIELYNKNKISLISSNSILKFYRTKVKKKDDIINLKGF